MVRDHHQLVFISQNGIVQRIAVQGIRPLGRNAQGFRLMRVRDDDVVSAVALVVEGDAPTAAGTEPVSLDASGDADEPALTGRLAEDALVAEDDGVLAADPTDDGLLTPPEVDPDDLEP